MTILYNRKWKSNFHSRNRKNFIHSRQAVKPDGATQKITPEEVAISYQIVTVSPLKISEIYSLSASFCFATASFPFLFRLLQYTSHANAFPDETVCAIANIHDHESLESVNCFHAKCILTEVLEVSTLFKLHTRV